MQPLGTKVYLLKRYSPSDSFCTFLSESVPWRGCCESVLQCTKTYSKTCDRMVSWTWPTQSPYLNMFERLWGILEEQVRKCFPQPTSHSDKSLWPLCRNCIVV